MTEPKKVTLFNVTAAGDVVLRTTRNGVFAKLHAQYPPTKGVRVHWRIVPLAVVEFSYAAKDMSIEMVEQCMSSVIELVKIQHPHLKVVRVDWWGVGRKRLTKESEDEETRTATGNA